MLTYTCVLPDHERLTEHSGNTTRAATFEITFKVIQSVDIHFISVRNASVI